jgi:hypothetical protein
LKNKPKNKLKPVTPKLRTKGLDKENTFTDWADIIFNFKRPEICDLTLDELLDKMVDQGVDSLTKVEKQKLEEYSKSL